MKVLKKICMMLIISVLIISQRVYANSQEEWKFFVTGKDSYSEEDTFKTIKIAETCDESTLTNGTIAPGTKGSFSIIIETDDLGAEYDVVFDNFSSDFPENFEFIVDGKTYDMNTGFHNQLDGEGTATHTVDWIWDFDGEDEYVERDISEISFRITVQASQVNEREEQTDELDANNAIQNKISRDVLPKTGF